MAHQIKICREKGCDNAQTTAGYCRYHYLKNWKTLKYRERKNSVQALNRYIEHVCSKHPDNYVAVVKRDLASPDFFSRRAETFLSDEDPDLLESLSSTTDMGRLLSHLRIDKAY